MANVKWSAFPAGSTPTVNDYIPGLQSSANVKWTVAQILKTVNSNLGFVTVAESPVLNAEYTSVNAAIAAGAEYIEMIGDTTDNATVNIPSTNSVYINILYGSTWTLDDCNIVTTTSFLVINTNYTGYVTFNNTSGSLPIIDSQSGYQVYLIEANINNNSTQANSPLCSGTTPLVSDYLSYSLPNLAGCGVASDEYCIFGTLSVYPSGGATNIDYGVNLTSYQTSIEYLWWYGSSGTTNPVVYLENCDVDKILMDEVTNNAIITIVNSTVKSLENTSTTTLKLNVNQNVSVDAHSSISNLTGNIAPTFNSPCDVNGFSSTAGIWEIKAPVKGVNCEAASYVVFSAGADRSLFTNLKTEEVCGFSNCSNVYICNLISNGSSLATTILADDITIHNGAFATNVNIQGNNNIISNSKITNGLDATVVINATYQNNIVTACITDVDVADSGTNTVKTGNTLIV